MLITPWRPDAHCPGTWVVVRVSHRMPSFVPINRTAFPKLVWGAHPFRWAAGQFLFASRTLFVPPGRRYHVGRFYSVQHSLAPLLPAINIFFEAPAFRHSFRPPSHGSNQKLASFPRSKTVFLILPRVSELVSNLLPISFLR